MAGAAEPAALRRRIKGMLNMAYTLALGMPGLTEWIIIGALGLLIFGKRLPEVGRSLGKGIVEFKKGLKGIEDDVEQVDPDTSKSSQRRVLAHDERKSEEPRPAHKFDPYTGKPIDQESDEHTTASK
jgi:sec-independent protein translocase protein TatA